MSEVSSVKLGDVAELIDYGVTASATDDPVGPKFLRITDIQRGNVAWSEVPHCEASEKERRKKRLVAGDIVIARTGATTGKSFLVRECPTDSVFASYLIRVRMGHQFDTTFVSHFFDSPSYWNQITTRASGSAQPGVNSTKLKELRVPVVSLEEQRRIAAILDKADTIRRKHRQALSLADELLRSTFLDMFGDPVANPKGWEVVSIGEFGAFERGKSKHRPRNDPALLGGPYPLIQTGDVANAEYFINSYSQTYSELGLKQSKMWSAGTLCITIAANIADTAVLGFDACFPDSVVGFVPKESVYRAYVKGLFGFLKRIIEERAPQVAQKNINLEILRALEVPRPDKNVLRCYEEAVVHQLKTRDRQRAAAEVADTFFASLSQRAFRGEL